MIEVWKPVHSYPPLEASSLGRIRRADTGEVKTPFKFEGYDLFKFCKDGRWLNLRVHRLVCEAFHGQAPEGKTDAAHGDGVRTNNTPDNLRWASRKENMADASRHGTIAGIAKGTAGSKNWNAKLTEDDVRAIRATPRRRGVLYELAARYGVSRNVIGNIRSNPNGYWAHVK